MLPCERYVQPGEVVTFKTLYERAQLRGEVAMGVRGVRGGDGRACIQSESLTVLKSRSRKTPA